jgi:hypothetical protein
MGRQVRPAKGVLAMADLGHGTAAYVRRRKLTRRFVVTCDAYPQWEGSIDGLHPIFRFRVDGDDRWILAGALHRGVDLRRRPSTVRLVFPGIEKVVNHRVDADAWLVPLPAEATSVPWQVELRYADGTRSGSMSMGSNLWEHLGSNPETPDGSGWIGYGRNLGRRSESDRPLMRLVAPSMAASEVFSIIGADLYQDRVVIRWRGGTDDPVRDQGRSGAPRGRSFELARALQVSDDVETNYVEMGSRASGERVGALDGATTFRPGVPPDAKVLTVTLADKSVAFTVEGDA